MVKIEGVIGDDVTLMDVAAAVKTEPDDKAVEVLINSPGGFVDEGLKIYEYLKSLRHGCNTTCVGTCASMGSIIFMAGTERRAGCDIMIHNPFIGEMYLTGATADELQAEADRLRELQDTLAEVYIKTAHLDRTVIQPMMDAETWIAPDMAVKLGIASSVLNSKTNEQSKYSNAVMAFAFDGNPKKQYNNMTFLDKLISRAKAVSAGNVKALTLKAADGTEITVDVPDGEEIQVGMTAAPDGEFILEDGRTVIIKDGIIEELKDGGEETEIEQLKQQLLLAQATIAQQNAVLEKYKQVIEDYEAKQAKTSGGFKSQGREFGKGSNNAKTADEIAKEYAQKRLEERKNARKK